MEEPSKRFQTIMNKGASYMGWPATRINTSRSECLSNTHCVLGLMGHAPYVNLCHDPRKKKGGGIEGRKERRKEGRMEEEQTVWPALSPVLPTPMDQTLYSGRVDKAKQRIPERPQLLDGFSRTVGRESSRQLVAWGLGPAVSC